MEDLQSKELLKFNKDYIWLKKQINSSKTNRFKSLLNHIKKGHFRYIYLRGLGELKQSKSIENNEQIVSEKRTVKGFTYDLSKKVVVYTIILGDYDELHEPLYINKNVKYICFTDKKSVPEGSNWSFVNIDNYKDILDSLSLNEKVKYLKMMPHLIFPKYDYSLYVDGKVQIITDVLPIIESTKDYILGLHTRSTSTIDCEKLWIENKGLGNNYDIDKQLGFYKSVGFNSQINIYETGIIVRQHNNLICQAVMKDWWDTYKNFGSTRDQLSFPYAVWKNNLVNEDIFSLGNNFWYNPRFRVYLHKKDNAK